MIYCISIYLYAALGQLLSGLGMVAVPVGYQAPPDSPCIKVHGLLHCTERYACVQKERGPAIIYEIAVAAAP